MQQITFNKRAYTDALTDIGINPDEFSDDFADIGMVPAALLEFDDCSGDEPLYGMSHCEPGDYDAGNWI